ncbi:MAG: ParM/StbA family protein [Eubacteriales bacterium]|nr:ParM/StbA family protein [Eubacteriales bacterium]
MTPLIIGIDHGYASIKTANFVFPSGVVAFDAPPPVQQGLLELEGRFFVCGSGRQPLTKDKTTNENYFLLTLAALAKEVRLRAGDGKAEVVIAAGLPLTGFGKDKAAFRSYLFPKKQPLAFRFEEQDYSILVMDVIVLPQGFSAIAANMAVLENEPSVVIIDIGGWTVDVMRMDNRAVDTSTCRSLELGVIRCMDEVKEQVRRSLSLSLTDAQVQAILSDEPCTVPEQAKAIVSRQGRLYVERLLSEINECGFDLKAIPAVFMGGGASLVKPRVAPTDGLCRPFYLADVSLNAKAFETIVGQRAAK